MQILQQKIPYRCLINHKLFLNSYLNLGNPKYSFVIFVTACNATDLSNDSCRQAGD